MNGILCSISGVTDKHMINKKVVPNNPDFLSPGNGIQPYQTKITVLGAGGAGNNTLARLVKSNPKEIHTVAVNTDAQDLMQTRANRKILIGRNLTGGLGAGGDPAIGERAAEETRDVLKATLDGTDLLFLTCGLGGGTGTGSLPFIGEMARNMGILTVAIVTMPFTEEGTIRWENAQLGYEKLKRCVDTLILLRNDKLAELVSDLPMEKAFSKSDEILQNAIIGLGNMVAKNGLINLDFADINMVLKDGPNAVIGLGESNSDNRISESVDRAIHHPMMEKKVKDAQSVLVHVSSGPDMTLKEAREVIRNLNQYLNPSARIIWGVNIERSLRHTIRIILILSGFQEEYQQEEAVLDESIGEFDTDHDEFGQPHHFPVDEPISQMGRSIFDIKESILASGDTVTTKSAPSKTASKTTMLFYKILEEEAIGDFKRFDRSIQLLRENQNNKRALQEAVQSCKLLKASAQMFGFDEISHLLSGIEEILNCISTKEIHMTPKILDSVTLAMELVVDLIENRSDGRGETGYIVDRLRELKQNQTTRTV